MTWFKFSRDWAYRNMRYTEKFKAGEHRNIPRHVANAAETAKAGKKEAKPNEKARTDSADIPAAN